MQAFLEYFPLLLGLIGLFYYVLILLRFLWRHVNSNHPNTLVNTTQLHIKTANNSHPVVDTTNKKDSISAHRNNNSRDIDIYNERIANLEHYNA